MQIFPNAPHSHEAGTTAWYEPSSFTPVAVGRSTNEASNPSPEDENDDEDQDGVLKTVDYVCDLIQAEIDTGIPVQRIVIGGFSQGCFVTLVAAMGQRFGGRIAGVVGLSGGLSHGKKIKEEMSAYGQAASDSEHKMRAFLAHGTRDMLVPTRIYRSALERVEETVGKEYVEGHLYEGLGHSTSGKEFLDMCAFLERIVPEV